MLGSVSYLASIFSDFFFVYLQVCNNAMTSNAVLSFNKILDRTIFLSDSN